MSNALVRVWFTLDIPEGRLEELVGRPDDDSDGWYEEAWTRAEEYVRDNLIEAIGRHALGEPDVECDG
jgi:hypothetical protein